MRRFTAFFVLSLLATLNLYSQKMWTWEGGSSSYNQAGIYGTLGEYNSENVPGARESSVTWEDGDGGIYLFGGDGYDSAGNKGYLNDFWHFNGTDWAWLGGSKLVNATGNYGDKGIFTPNSFPGARAYAAAWTDNNGRLYLFGGRGIDEDFVDQYDHFYLNDLWVYDQALRNWSWVSGNKTGWPFASYGTKNISDPSNLPGGRINAAGYYDPVTESSYIFGGRGIFAGTFPQGRMNDVWRFNGTNWVWIKGEDSPNHEPVYNTKGAFTPENDPGTRTGFMSGYAGAFVVIGGGKLDPPIEDFLMIDLWAFNGTDWMWYQGSSEVDTPGEYISGCELSDIARPGARRDGAYIYTMQETVHIFGGLGYDQNGDLGYLNDLWITFGGRWKWCGGSNVADTIFAYPDKYMSAVTNQPNGRINTAAWAESDDDIFIFGGKVKDSLGNVQYANDLWRYGYSNWFLDSDSDGYGTINEKVRSRLKPEGYVANVDDCDDTSADFSPETVWYADSDGDGFGDASVSSIQCQQPVGYVLDNTDNDDSDATKNPDATDTPGSGEDLNGDGEYLWFEDIDEDGYGSASIISSANAEAGVGESVNNDDCDDANNAINPETVWYTDNDGDGYGDASTSLIQCEQPTGYVLNNSDCDDSSAGINPENIWYLDADEDGFGNSNNNISQCPKPEGYVQDNTDCNDSDARINPETIWFQDADGDGFGNTSNTLIQCQSPNGYVLNDLDCNDNDVNDVPETWYADNDNDGYGNHNSSINRCEQPAGYVSDFSDCNDYDVEINPATVWYQDTDEDGFGNATSTIIQCEQPAGYVLENTDCDDTEAAINPETVWYADSDGDGFGDAGTSLIQCAQPNGFVLDNTDNDDSDETKNPDATDTPGSGEDANGDGEYLWFEDIDGDGYGTSVTVISTNATAGAEEAANDEDCDDTDADVNPQTVWYADSDGDGFGDASTSQVQCIQPDGYVLDNTDNDDSDETKNPDATDEPGSGEDANGDGEYLWFEDSDGDGYGTSVTVVSNNATAAAGESANDEDCDDTDAGINPETVWYADSDGDGFGDSSTSLIQCNQPDGFVLDSTDNDDSDDTKNPDASDQPGTGEDANGDGEFLWYEDVDGDGYGTSVTVISTNATAGDGESANDEDCDDTDADINPQTVWYADSDGDGFGDGGTSLVQCNQPDGYVLDNTDNDDSDETKNPDATEEPGSGEDANGDGQYLWYEDADGDGYGSTATVSSTNAAVGAGESANSDDCDDTMTMINPETIWYGDGDEDGFGNSEVSITQCEQPDGFVLNDLDCDDDDNTVTEECILSNNMAATMEVKVFPNPSNGYVNISSTEDIETISVISETGKLIKLLTTIDQGEKDYRLELGEISASKLYVKIVFSDGSYSVEKVIMK